LDSRSARSRLAVSGKPYYRALDAGLHLGYRKGKAGGKWVARWYVGEQQYRVETLPGIADDTQDADGTAVLAFHQAQARARELYLTAKRGSLPSSAPLTVKQACASYLAFLDAERAATTAHDTKIRLALHVDPTLNAVDGDEKKSTALGDTPVARLTKDLLDKWKRGMVRRNPDDADVERRSKDSANRVLSMLKAALNRAFEDDANGIPSDAAWRRCKPFRHVGRAREVHLDRAQSKRLINSCKGAFRIVVTAALLTGARPPHELASPRVRDFHANLGTLSVTGKTGPRDIVLTAEAVRFFEEISAGKPPDALLLSKDDGTPWKKNHHVRPMKEAAERAKLPADATIYCLRHTYASQSILAGMNLKLLAENMGTSIRMLEQHYGKFIAASRRKLVEESSFKLGLRRANVERLRHG
jgi:integrase